MSDNDIIRLELTEEQATEMIDNLEYAGASELSDIIQYAIDEKRGSSFDWYEDLTHETAVYPQIGVAAKQDSPDEHDGRDIDIQTGMLYTALGLNGEAGEVAEKIKKDLRGDNPDEPLDIGDELGDVLWYLARLCVELDYSFDAIARRNASKLTDRKERDVLKGSGDDR